MSAFSHRDPFANVIVGIDGRVGGRDALALARLLIAPDGQLTLVHVHDGDELPTRATNLYYDAVQRELSDRLLEGECRRAEVFANSISTGAASVAVGLLRVAAVREADLIVVGSCSRGVIGRAMLGDDARDTLRAAECAVAVAPRRYATDLQPIRTIGVGYDDSTESRAALALARDLAHRYGARVQALTAVASPFVGSSGGAAALAIEPLYLDAWERIEALQGVRGDVAIGPAAATLDQFSETVDLLIVGSRSRSGIRRALFGSTSEHLERNAQCPVIVVPHAVAEDHRHGLGLARASSTMEVPV